MPLMARMRLGHEIRFRHRKEPPGLYIDAPPRSLRVLRVLCGKAPFAAGDPPLPPLLQSLYVQKKEGLLTAKRLATENGDAEPVEKPR